MEATEYIEHYGLFPGYLDTSNKISPDCSWNAPHRFSNMF